jgi:Kef-type K+ transport system membrane component KefB
MELSSILISLVFMLGATAICIILLEHLGFGSILGFIIAGIIIGPQTPGLVASQHVDELQNTAIILGFAFAISSKAIIMTILQERGALSSPRRGLPVSPRPWRPKIQFPTFSVD